MTEDNINNLLNKFSCSQDLDIENFLKEKAIKFERLLKARTYLILNEEELIDSNDISNVNIYGYFSIALKVLTILGNLLGILMYPEIYYLVKKYLGMLIALYYHHQNLLVVE